MSPAALPPAQAARPPGTARAVIAAVIGNALEWYDFLVYAIFAVQIAHSFFPARTPTASLLLAVATFGAGFVLRPIGAVVLGQYADRRGRRPALTLIILMMTLATAVMVFTPGYRTIGLAAPLLIVASRLLQGFSVGGELGSSTALLIESAPPGQRGVYASLQGATQWVASLGAAAAGVLTATLLGPHALAAWGWRLPFAVGLLIGPVGLYLRAHLDEPEAGGVRLRPESTPLLLLWRAHRGAVIQTIGLIAMGTMATYILGISMPSYAQQQLHLPPRGTFLSTVIADAVAIGLAPWSGRLSDRFGARPIMLPAAILLALGVFPGFVLLTHSPSVPTLIAVQTAGCAVLAVLSGPLYALIGSLFPAEVRSTGLSVGYNVSVLAFGGFAPFVTTWLIAATGNRTMPGLYVTAGAALTIPALLVGWRRSRARGLRSD
jgi:MHS family proline/betaine transporter-like MFS transporter